MRHVIPLAGLAILTGCKPPAPPPPPAARPAQLPAGEQRQTLLMNPAWEQYALAHYQSQVRAMLDDPNAGTFPSPPASVVAEYVPGTGTTLTARGELQIETAPGQQHPGFYFVRWTTPGRATTAEVPWRPGFVSVSPEPPPPTTTTSPGPVSH
jgi:hypothetical protein